MRKRKGFKRLATILILIFLLNVTFASNGYAVDLSSNQVSSSPDTVTTQTQTNVMNPQNTERVDLQNSTKSTLADRVYVQQSVYSPVSTPPILDSTNDVGSRVYLDQSDPSIIHKEIYYPALPTVPFSHDNKVSQSGGVFMKEIIHMPNVEEKPVPYTPKDDRRHNEPNLSINKNISGVTNSVNRNTFSSSLVFGNLNETAVDETDLTLVDDDAAGNSFQDLFNHIDSIDKNLEGSSVTDSMYNIGSEYILPDSKQNVTTNVYSVSDNINSFPIHNKAGKFSVRFPRQAKSNLFQFSFENANLTIGLVNPASTFGIVNANHILYENIYPSTDIRYTVEPSRLKEDLIVKQYTGQSDFFFNLNIQGAIYKRSSDSAIYFYDPTSDEPLFYMPKGYAMDSDGNRCDSVNLEFTEEGLLKVAVDPGWLQKASYPVVVDPSIVLASGDYFTLTLKSNGTVWASGSNNYGQLGDGTTTTRYTPVQVGGLTDVVAVAAGGYHSIALKSDGTVWTWGYNYYGQLGDGTITNRYTPVQVSGLTGVVAIEVGSFHSMALKSDGSVWTWGRNNYGQLGDGTTTTRYTPVQVSNLTGVVDVWTNYYHSVALKSDGTVWTWGYNYYGQLGDGTTTNRYTPVQVSNLTGIEAIAAGSFYTVALKSDGTVWTWGSNNRGQLGDGTTTTRYLPGQVSNLIDVVAITAADSHCVALKSDGTVWTWGYNSQGQLGDGTFTNRYTPVQVSGLSDVAVVTAGNYNTMALKTDGTVWIWGDNSYGQLGKGKSLRKSIPVQVYGVTDIAFAGAGYSHSIALKSDGSVWTWGYNYFGQLGDGTTTNRYTPVQVSGQSDSVAVEAGYYHTICLKSDGTAWTWGYNYFGQLGDGTTTTRYTPVQASGLTGVMAVAAGDYHSIALKSDGSVWTWGRNNYGQLGDGTITTRYTPIQVSGLTGVVSIAAGTYYSVALKSDGTVWSWGDNYSGQLGDGTTTRRYTPVQVSGLTGVIAIAAGDSHTVALKSDSTVWTWGYNYYGQLGDGTTTNRYTPVQVSGLTGVIAIVAGNLHSIALKSDGTVRTWGDNSHEQLGDGTTTNRYTPVQVSNLTGVEAIAAGSFYSIALKSDGTEWTWGENQYGQLGDDNPPKITVPMQSPIALYPEVIGSDPANYATNVPVNKNIAITFSLPVQAGTNISGISVKKGTTVENYNYSISNNVLTLVPLSYLDYNVNYTVYLPAGAVNDIMTGAPLRDSFTFSFTTQAAPQVGSGIEPYWNYTSMSLGGGWQASVNTYNLNLVLSKPLFLIPGRGMPIGESITYNSIQGCWTFGNYTSVIENIDGSVVYSKSDGGSYTFTPNGTGGYIAPTGVYLTLQKNAVGSFTILDKYKNTYNYVNGRPFQFKDRNDNTTTFTYDANGRLYQVSDPSGRKLTYSHNADGSIESVTDPANRAYQFSYVNGHLTLVIDPDYNYFNIIYGENGRVASFVDPLNHWTSFFGNPNGQITSLRDARTTSQDVYETIFTSSLEDSTVIATVYDPGNKRSTFYHDNNTGTMTKFEDGLGNTWQYVWENNNLTQTQDAKGQTTYQYDSWGNVTSETTTVDGNYTNNIIKTMTYDDDNQLLEVIDGSGRKTSYKYSNEGNLLSTSDPELKESNGRKYDQYGNVVEYSPGVSASHNQVVNGSMEIPGTGGNLLAGWTRVPGTATASLDGFNSHGNSALKITSSTPTTDLFRQDVYASASYPHRKLTLRADIKLDNVQPSGTDGGAVIKLDDGWGNWKAWYVWGSGTPTVTLTYQAVRDNYVSVYIGLVNASGTAWFDGVQLENAFDTSQGYILSSFSSNENAGFEDGGSYWGYNGTTTTYTTEAAWESLYSLKVNLPTSGVETFNQDVPVYGGEPLTVSGMVKTDNVTGSGAYYKVDYYDASNNLITGTTVQTGYVTGTQDWVRLTSIATAPANAHHARVQGILDGSGTAYFDAVKLIPRNTQKYTYDTAGNYVNTSEDASGKQQNYTYNQDTGSLLTFTDALSHTTTYGYDNLNRLYQVTDPLTRNSYYDYDSVSNLVYSRDPRSVYSADNTYRSYYGPDSLNRLSNLTDPLNQNATYLYDRSGNLIQVLLPHGLEQDFTYDAANRLEKTTLDGGKYFTFSYDGANELTGVTDQDNNTYSWSYDGAHRLTSSTDTFSYTLNYAWDKSNNLTFLYGSDYGSFRYNYGSNNQLLWLQLPDNSVVYYDYDENGRIFQVRYPWPNNNDKRVINYAANGWVTQIVDPSFPGQYNYNYGYYSNGTIDYYSSWAGTDYFNYDANGRLTNWYYSPRSGSSIQENYTYDAAGNLTTKGSQTFTYNSANQITNSGYTYDANGNMTGDGIYIYTYNALNQLVRVNRASDNSLIATYEYNHNGLRKSKTVSGVTTTYNWDASGNLVRETTSGSSTYFYYVGGKLVSLKKNGTTYILHDNLRGDVETITDTSGNIVAQAHYDPWGNRIESSGSLVQPFRYAGYYYDDETGLYYLKSRYYSPVLGRFLTRDGIGYISKSVPQTLNLYVYCGNNPVSMTDPKGTSYAIPGGQAKALLAIITLWLGAKTAIEYLKQTAKDAWESLYRSDEDSSETQQEEVSEKNLTDKPGKIANKIGKNVDEVKGAIEKVKQGNSWRSGTKTRNPDVKVDTKTGEVYPKLPDGGIGDSIGNIWDYFE